MAGRGGDIGLRGATRGGSPVRLQARPLMLNPLPTCPAFRPAPRGIFALVVLAWLLGVGAVCAQVPPSRAGTVVLGPSGATRQFDLDGDAHPDVVRLREASIQIDLDDEAEDIWIDRSSREGAATLFVGDLDGDSDVDLALTDLDAGALRSRVWINDGHSHFEVHDSEGVSEAVVPAQAPQSDALRCLVSYGREQLGLPSTTCRLCPAPARRACSTAAAVYLIVRLAAELPARAPPGSGSST